MVFRSIFFTPGVGFADLPISAETTWRAAHDCESAFGFTIIRATAHGGWSMQDRIEHALRRWTHLRREPGEVSEFRRGEALAVWLQRDVCPVVQELMARADFRQACRWSIDNLLPGRDTPARELIDAIDKALIADAEAMVHALERVNRDAKLAPARARRKKPADRCPQQKNIPRLIDKVVSGESQVARSEEEQSSDPAVNSDKPGETDQVLLSTLKFIAKRPWRDLVSEYDFFSPAVDLNLRNRDDWLAGTGRVQVGAFLPFLEPKLSVPCDFVMTCVEQRVIYWQTILQRASVELQRIFRRSNSDHSADERALREATPDLRSRVAELGACVYDAGEFSSRTACMILAQVYAAYFPKADFGWLGEASQMAGNALRFRWSVEQRTNEEIPETVAKALTDLVPFYRRDLDVELYIQEMARTRPLCLVDGRCRRAVYWNHSLLDIEWERHSVAWTLLTEMAAKAKTSGQGVDEACDLGISLKDAHQDLTKFLPLDLADFLHKKNKVYQLKLPEKDICYLRFTSVDKLEEVGKGIVGVRP